jgi:8-oxo-dGTP pyrophosphatase MutT (NUDIX family)
MYKVFFNDNSISFGSEAEKHSNSQSISEGDFLAQTNTILNNLLTEQSLNYHIETSGNEIVWDHFKKHFTLIEAAGGFVLNEENELLCIHRLGKWDLPKGKLEEGEKIEECAIREVEEECGIEQLQITTKVFHTYHTYILKGQPILKQTHWYGMKTFKQELTPQTEEDITEVIWADANKLLEIVEHTYPNIKIVIDHFKSDAA